MNGKRLFTLIEQVDDDLILEALPASWGGKGAAARPPRPRHSLGRFFDNGWVIAALCVLVSGAVLGGVIWLGRQDPSGPVPPVGTSASETDPLTDMAPYYDLNVRVSSGPTHIVSEEIFLGGTLYTSSERLTDERGGDARETMTVEGEPLPDGDLLRALAPDLLADPVRTVFAEDTLLLSTPAPIDGLHVYDRDFVEIAAETSLDALPTGTYYVVVETRRTAGTMQLPGEEKEYPVESLRYAYVFALIKQDFWAAYPGNAPTLHLTGMEKNASGNFVDIEYARVSAVMHHNVTLHMIDANGNKVTYKQPYRVPTPEEVLAMKGDFEAHTIPVFTPSCNLDLWDGFGGKGALTSTYAYREDTGDFIVGGSLSSLDAYIDGSCYLLFRYTVTGDSITMGGMTYEIDEISYEFPAHYETDRDYTDYTPLLWLGAGEDATLALHRYPWKAYSEALVREHAAADLPLYVNVIRERLITVSPDTPLTITLGDPKATLREVCVFDAAFAEVAAGADPSLIGKLPPGDYYVVAAVNARGRTQRTGKIETLCHLYYAAVRVEATGGGIAEAEASNQILTLQTNHDATHDGQIYHLTDNCRDPNFDPHVAYEDAMKNVPATLSDHLRQMADANSAGPVVMTRTANTDVLDIVKPFNSTWLYSVAIYNEAGERVAGDANTKLFPMSDWPEVWGITHLCCDLPAGRYYMVIKLDLPESPDGKTIVAYDYPVVLIKE